MASTDYPLSVSSKFVDDAGTEHLVTVRGRNLEDFRSRLQESGAIFPYASFTATAPAASVATKAQPLDTPTPISPVAAGEAQATQGAQARSAQARVKAKAPKCATHSIPMRESKHGGYYCPGKMQDGSYCDVRVAA